MNEDAPFDSAHQAMLFAFNFAAIEHGTAGAAERQIAVQSRERYEDLPMASTGRRMKGVDGAHQAGRILVRLQTQMSPIELVVLAARFHVKDEARRKAACMALAVWGVRSGAIGGGVCQNMGGVYRLVRKFFGVKLNVGRFADRYAVDERTVRRWAISVRRWLEPIDRQTMAHAEDILQQAGVVRRPVQDAVISRGAGATSRAA